MPITDCLQCRYSDQEEFDRLWLLESPAAGRVVIEWDDTPNINLGPPGAVEPGEYLTPFDWAICMALKHPSHDWRLYLLDHASDRYPGAHAAWLFRQAPGLLPWMRIYQDAEELRRDLAEPPFSVTRRLGPGDLDMLRSIWAAGFTKPDTRHAIANLVGPHLLLRGMGTNPPLSPLDTLLDAAGLFPIGFKEYEQPPWCDPVPQVDRFVLLDDMADLGWTEFLRISLGTTAVTGISDPQAILSPLRAALEDRAPLALGGTPKEVLFLDLRLFPGDPEGERAFLRELLQFTELFPYEFDDADLIRAYVNGQEPEKREHHLALTLLPRLLSLADPRLPIVLFSSTGRKEVIDRLARHRNIVLDFEKPRFSAGESAATVSEAKLRLRRAIDQVRQMVRARAVCAELMTARDAIPAAHNGAAVEIYVDESGDPSVPGLFAIGGIVLTYPDAADIGKVNQELWNRGLIRGFAEGLPDHLPAIPLKKKYSTNDKYERHLLKYQQLFQEMGIGIRAFALVRRSDLSAAPGVQDGDSENIYRQDLGAVLEAAVFDVLAGTQSVATDIRVHVATRIFEVANPAQQDDLRRKFGISGFEDEDEKTGRIKYMCFSLSANEVYPLLNEVRMRRRTVSRNTTWARGAVLQETRRKPHDRPFQIHYLADWVVRLGLFYVNGTPLPATAARWYADGFIEPDREAFLDWLQASRCLDNGDVVGGMLAASRALRPGDFQRWVRSRLATAASRLPSDLFASLSHKL